MSENKTSQQPILFAAGSPANPTALQVQGKHPQTKETCGASLPVLFASVNPHGCWLKMYQEYFQARLDGSLVEYSQTWPQAGMVSNGKAYRLRRLVRRISARGSLLLPTMRASEKSKYQYNHGDHSKKNLTLLGYVNLYPTPTANDAKNNASPSQQRRRVKGFSQSLNVEVNGKLNPRWVEWLMGFPDGWTDLEDLETP